jgi:hypothetical protein
MQSSQMPHAVVKVSHMEPTTRRQQADLSGESTYGEPTHNAPKQTYMTKKEYCSPNTLGRCNPLVLWWELSLRGSEFLEDCKILKNKPFPRTGLTGYCKMWRDRDRNRPPSLCSLRRSDRYRPRLCQGFGRRQNQQSRYSRLDYTFPRRSNHDYRGDPQNSCSKHEEWTSNSGEIPQSIRRPYSNYRGHQSCGHE